MKRPDPEHQSTAATVPQILEKDPETAAIGLTGAFFTRIERFAEVLKTWGARTNLTAHPDDPKEVAFHVIDSLAPIRYPDSRQSLRGNALDLGSGGGFPGLILAAAMDHAEFTLVEGRRKRASFLLAAAAEMKLTNVEVLARRASRKTVTETFDVVTSRAVGDVGLEIAAAALRRGGVVMMWLNQDQRIEEAQIHAAGLGEPRYLDYAVRRADQVVSRRLALLRKE